MLGVRGREAMGSWIPREEEQEARRTELCYDLRRSAHRDQWYRIGRSPTDRERATAGLDKVRTLDQKGRDSLARFGKWTARLIDEHAVEWDDDAIRTRAL